MAAHQTPVLVVARDVPLGQVIQQQDLRTVSMGTDPSVQWIDTRNRANVVGQRAAVDLKSGSVLAPSQVTAAVVPAAGQAVVPLAVKASQLPARGIRPGDNVTASVVLPDAQTEQNKIVDHPGQVDRVGQPDADGVLLVDLLVPVLDGTALARQATAGKVALVLQSRAR